MSSDVERRKSADARKDLENEMRRIDRFCSKLKVSIITWYILALIAWAMCPFGLFDKEGLLDIKQWELFLVCTSVVWFLWFTLSGRGR